MISHLKGVLGEKRGMSPLPRNINAKPPMPANANSHSLRKHKHNAGTSEAHVAAVHERAPGMWRRVHELKLRVTKVCDNFVVPGGQHMAVFLLDR